MTITPTNVNGTAPNVNADGTISTATTGGTTDANSFLTLLVNELQNQDPTAPTDEKQTLAQLAQFTELQQIQTLNTTVSGAVSLSQVSQNAALIGKTVSTASASAAGITGVVTGVTMANGKTSLMIGTQSVDPTTITSIQ